MSSSRVVHNRGPGPTRWHLAFIHYIAFKVHILLVLAFSVNQTHNFGFTSVMHYCLSYRKAITCK